MNNKTAQVVMLPTNDKTSLKKFVGNINQLFFDNNNIVAQNQHLHFVTDDPIEKYDWVTNTKVIVNYNSIDDIPTNSGWFKKIIASTDKSLKLPTIPLTWIRDVFVPSNDTIKEVELETEAKYDIETFRYVRHGLVFGDDGDVVILSGQKTTTENYNKAVNDIKNGFLTDGRQDEMIVLLKKPETIYEEQQNWYNYMYGGLSIIKPNYVIKAGANRQEKQSATDAIDFFKWVNLNYIESNSYYENDIKVSTYVHRSEGGIPSRIEKLYELWKN